MCVWKWIGDNSGTLQAIAAILGLAILIKYAWDTRTIARATARQSKDNLLPFLALTLENIPGQLTALQFKMQNQGLGPAINVRHYLPDNPIPRQRPTIMQGQDALIGDTFSVEGRQFYEWLRDGNEFIVEYESIAGEKLKSSFVVEDGFTVQVRFTREMA